MITRYFGMSIVGAMILAAVSGQGATLYVAHNGQTPGGGYTAWGNAASNIQDAVTAAAIGDTIVVGPGRYTGANNIYGGPTYYVFYAYDKPLTIRSSGGAGVTIIDGQGAQTGVLLGTDDPGRPGPYIIDGFTVSNSYAISSSAGVHLYTGNLSVTSMVLNCVITHNTTTDASGAGGVGGGGANGAHLLMLSNTVVRSSTGGGVAFVNNHNSARTMITGCSIEDNSGCGVAFQGWQGTNYMWNTKVQRNINSGSGGGIYIANVPMELRNCLIANNRSENNAGGAMYIRNNYANRIYNCTIVGNAVPLRWYSGTGVAVGGDAGIAVWNTICVSNISDNGYAEDFYISGTAAYTNSCCTGQVLLGDGNTMSEPAFVDFAGKDFHLTRRSPCVDTGLNQAWMIGAVDLDGNPRKDLASGIVDMGCYESFPVGTLIMAR